MSELTQEQKDARQEAIRLGFAYQEFFGREGSRNALQKLIFDDLCARARINSPIFVRDSVGALDPLRAAIAEGGRLFMLNLIEILKSDFNEPQKSVTVKK